MSIKVGRRDFIIGTALVAGIPLAQSLALGGPKLDVMTSRFGAVAYSAGDVIDFPNGLIAFTELKRFILLDCQSNRSFTSLQSLDDGSINFLLVSRV